MHYENLMFTTEADAEAAFARNDTQEVRLVVVSAAMYAEEFAWVQEFCIRLATHPDANVRGNAILGFAHLARRFGMLDKQKVLPHIRVGLNDANDWVRGQADAAADDVEWLLKWKVR